MVKIEQSIEKIDFSGVYESLTDLQETHKKRHRECEDGKIGLRKLGSKLKQNPCDQNNRTELNKQKKNFKKLVKSKKHQHKYNTTDN